MWAKTDTTNYTNIAAAIREKNGATDQYTPAQMAAAIMALEVGGGDDGSFRAVLERTAVSPTLPDDLTKIGRDAFSGCASLALTSLPEGVTSIGNGAFYDCTSLALTSLPAGVTSIGYGAFYGCTSLALTSLPAGVTSIGDSAFYGCTSLTALTFMGKPAFIGPDAFSNCPKLTTINVPWAEGAVADAPWGATNATINYNYTGG